MTHVSRLRFRKPCSFVPPFERSFVRSPFGWQPQKLKVPLINWLTKIMEGTDRREGLLKAQLCSVLPCYKKDLRYNVEQIVICPRWAYMNTMGCLMIMEIWAIYPLLPMKVWTKPYLVAISHFSTPLIYKKDRTPIDCINLKLLFSDPQ